ncbi:MAG: VanZ family protein [Spirochaetes bacterium]|nr:VanZ family protein [Spirochaetota bacterium]
MIPFKKYSRYITFFTYALILFLSLIPSSIQGPENADKIGHFCAYAVLSFLCSFSFRNRKILFIAINIILGITIEFIQSFVPGRTMSFFDALANTLGIFTGFMLFKIFIKLTEKD